MAVADILRTLSGRPGRRRVRIDNRAVELVRDYLTSHAGEQTPASTLERITGDDRFRIARHFRLAFGTSPDRYRTMRGLALARTAIESGLPLARAAADAGFADQSHMTRQFKKTYGLTPGHWATAVAAARPCARWSGYGRHPRIGRPRDWLRRLEAGKVTVGHQRGNALRRSPRAGEGHW